MRRWLCIVLITLCASLVLNVLVAWFFALRVDDHVAAGRPFSLHRWTAQGRSHVAIIHSSEGARIVAGFSDRNLDNSPGLWGPARLSPESDWSVREKSLPDRWIAESFATMPKGTMSTHVASGWPFLSMTYGVPGVWIRGDHTRGGLDLGDAVNVVSRRGRAGSNVVPLTPIWAGFVANVAIFASTILTIVVALTVARRTWRRTRGRCAMCGYPVGRLPRCTECGHTLGESTKARLTSRQLIADS